MGPAHHHHSPNPKSHHTPSSLSYIPHHSIASVLETASYCHETDYEQRHNVLLVGDSLGDLHMSDGCVGVDVVMTGSESERTGPTGLDTYLPQTPFFPSHNVSLAFEEIVRVGFLNDRVDERLAEYQAKFDVVIVGDPDLTFVVGLLREVVAGGANGEGDGDGAAASTELR